MTFHPMLAELAASPRVRGSEFLTEICAATMALYEGVPEPMPWVGYLLEEHGVFVGTCAFKAAPVDGEVEIAYFTFPGHEGRGVATRMAQHLIAIAEERDVAVRAQTMPEVNPSTRILEKLGFELHGPVIHPEDGEVWEWKRRRTDP